MIDEEIKKAFRARKHAPIVMQCFINKTRQTILDVSEDKEKRERSIHTMSRVVEFDNWTTLKMNQIIEEAKRDGFGDFLNFHINQTRFGSDVFFLLKNNINTNLIDQIERYQEIEAPVDENGQWTSGYSINQIAHDAEINKRTAVKEVDWLLKQGFIIRKTGSGNFKHPYLYQVVNQEWINQ